MTRGARSAAAGAVLAAAALAVPAGPPAAVTAGPGAAPPVGSADGSGRSARADTTGGPVVLARAWRAMGTLLELTAVAPDTAAARRALSAGRAEVLRLDSLLSTYRPESEVSRLNAAAGSGEWTRLSPATARALREALRWAERTGGAVDPTVGPLVAAWGFRGRRPEVPGPAALDSARRLVGWERVETADGGRRARLPRRGMRLDFGALGKGLALERAVDAMREAGAAGGMADLGGQVSVFGRPPPARGGRWRLGIRHPRAGGAVLGALAVDSGSVATSGDAEQFFVRDGVRYSHVLDARTGRPARGVAQVTAAAADGSTADALATALFVLGPAEGRRWLERRGRLGRGPGQLSLALWVRDPGEGPLCPGDVVRAGPAAGRVELAFGPACPDRPGGGRRPALPAAAPRAPGPPGGSLPAECESSCRTSLPRNIQAFD